MNMSERSLKAYFMAVGTHMEGPPRGQPGGHPRPAPAVLAVRAGYVRYLPWLTTNRPGAATGNRAPCSPTTRSPCRWTTAGRAASRSRCSPARSPRPPAARHRPPDRPWLLFLQGGPGFGAMRPAGREAWLDRALDDYRVLLLDQRGTGRSTPATGRPCAAGAAPGPGRLPGPLPRRLDRPRRRTDPPPADRRRAVERARPELRRVLHGQLPVAGAGGPPGGVHHRRAARPGRARGRRLPGHLSDRGQAHRRTTSGTRRTRTGPGRSRRYLASTRSCARRRAADRRRPSSAWASCSA